MQDSSGFVKQNERKTRGRYAAGMSILVLMLFVAFFLTYKTELQDLIYSPVKITLSSLHKKEEEFDIMLTGQQPVLSETFDNRLSDIRSICVRVNKVSGWTGTGRLRVTLLDRETGGKLAEAFFTQEELEEGILKLIPEQPISAVDRELTLQLKLETDSLGEESVRPEDPVTVGIRANRKQGLVLSFNNDPENKTNLISEIHYSNGQGLKWLYVILCAALLIFALLGYWLLIFRGLQLWQAFLPLAFVLGGIYCLLLPAYSVPDENVHMDNSYKYSNWILGIEDTGEPGTIFKRSCDALQADLMANTLESNHYVQLRDHLLEKPGEKEKGLIAVSYLDSGMMVPALNYIPCALGISLGRVLGTSALMTLTLGRYCSLITFAFLTYLALLFLPYGKNAAAMLMLVPIALQQGASSSYDAVMNGMILLFIACCLNVIYGTAEAQGAGAGRMTYFRNYVGTGWRRNIILMAMMILLALYLARTKGGVFLPLCLLILPAIARFLKPSGKRAEGGQEREPEDKNKKWIIAAVIAVGVFLCGLIFIRVFWSFIASMLDGAYQTANGQGYSIAWLLTHPAQLLYKYWNTFQHSTDNYIRGLMGGTLSWLDISVNRVYPMLFLGGTILLAHTEGDRFTGKRALRVLLLISGCLTVLLIMFSMLVAYTSTNINYIAGVQGRYFLGFAIVFFLGFSTDMIHVNRKQTAVIAITMIFTEVLTVLSVVGKVS